MDPQQLEISTWVMGDRGIPMNVFVWVAIQWGKSVCGCVCAWEGRVTRGSTVLSFTSAVLGTKSKSNYMHLPLTLTNLKTGLHKLPCHLETILLTGTEIQQLLERQHQHLS